MVPYLLPAPPDPSSCVAWTPRGASASGPWSRPQPLAGGHWQSSTGTNSHTYAYGCLILPMTMPLDDALSAGTLLRIPSQTDRPFSDHARHVNLMCARSPPDPANKPISVSCWLPSMLRVARITANKPMSRWVSYCAVAAIGFCVGEGAEAGKETMAEASWKD